MQTTSLTLCNLAVPPHIPDVSDLCSRLIMNKGIGPVLLSKTQNLTKGSVVNMIVSTVYHPVDIISGLVIEICCMKLSKHLLIPVVLKSLDV
jgi:hypothetical protein